MGMKGRMTFRLNKMKSKSTLQMYRSGWRRMWDYAPEHLTRWKIPKADSWDPSNQMGGVMWATPAEYRRNPLSGNRLALILETAFDNGCSADNMKLMRKTCSFLYQLHTGQSGENFPVVNGMMVTLDLKRCGPPSKSLIPTKILPPPKMREAYLKEWDPNGPMTFVDFMQGALATWDWCVLGARTVCDLNKIKESEEHDFDEQNKCWSTAYPGGRSKLPMHKAGSRPWRAWGICLCPDNVHIPPPEDFEYSFTKKGNPRRLPRLCTTCPLFIGQLLERMMRWKPPFRRYRKWLKAGHFGKSDHPNVVHLSLRWLANQGVMDAAHPFDTNSGRKALAAWNEELDVRYNESVHIHGDLEDVFRKSYYPLLPQSGGYKVREQSLDYRVATAGLVKLRGYFGRDPPPEPPPPGLTKDQQVLLMLADQAGLRRQALQVYQGPD